MYNNLRRGPGGTKDIGGVISHQRMAMDMHHDRNKWRGVAKQAEMQMQQDRYN